MNANEAPDNVGVTKQTAETPVCRRLRTKMYYVLGREAVNLRESSPTAQYWCSLTATVMGPDDMWSELDNIKQALAINKAAQDNA